MRRRISGKTRTMYVGIALVLVAVGAVLHFATGLDTGGLIVMAVGLAGVVIALFFELAWPDRRNGFSSASRG
jgi:uncharacterized iron-regulated membrane protein